MNYYSYLSVFSFYQTNHFCCNHTLTLWLPQVTCDPRNLGQSCETMKYSTNEIEDKYDVFAHLQYVFSNAMFISVFP